MIETAKLNGLEPYTYLCRVFEDLPKAQTLADIESLLPWQIDDGTVNLAGKNRSQKAYPN